MFDEVQANVERGAVLRTVSILNNEIAFNLETGEIADDTFFGVILEEQDQEGGDLLDFVEVYIGYRDNTGGESTVAESLNQTIPASEFTIGEFGLPRVEYTITGAELLAATGLSGSDLDGGDQFSIRFEVVLTDGRRYSFADNSGTLTGSFFSSPFLYTPNVVCSVDPTFFTGQYTMVQLSGSSPFGIGDGFTQTEPVTVVANGDTNRTFAFVYDPGGFGSSYEMSIDLVCGEFQNVAGRIAAGGLGCGDGSIGQTGSTVDITTYDQTAGDASFTITFFDFDPSGGCSPPPNEVVVRLDKI
ncbi:hypothetical protein [Robiginitalea sp. IMCC43444]|uniref:hypothetical protein n=1 Tax=Robiginitalea sp. IMCC43444 TaxID=3459121 RepID=UPI00404131BC